jgi:hypothetical protein
MAPLANLGAFEKNYLSPQPHVALDDDVRRWIYAVSTQLIDYGMHVTGNTKWTSPG